MWVNSSTIRAITHKTDEYWKAFGVLPVSLTQMQQSLTQMEWVALTPMLWQFILQ